MNAGATFKQLTGQCSQHLADVCGAQIHENSVSDWQALQRAAKKAGFDLAIASAYRSYDRQLAIWNQKASGQRAVLNKKEQSLDIQTLSQHELVFAILYWSALPGASRHHWGTDIDVYDKNALPDGGKLMLTQVEVEKNGVFSPLHQWLDQCITANKSFGFYRPYTGQNAVAAERWHLSHKPSSQFFQAQLSCQSLYDFYDNNHEVMLKSEILSNFDTIYADYICV